MNGIFFELTFVLILAGGIALIVSFLKQPSIIAYIVAGLLLGPLGYYQLREHDALHGLAQIGITLLLFMVGLELDVAQFKRMGKAALIAGFGQIFLTGAASFVILKSIGVATVPALYLGLALSFSSTIIVVKLLSEKHDLQSLYGKISIGILLIQDFVAIFFLIALTSFGNAGSEPDLPLLPQILFTISKAILLFLMVLFFSKKILPRILKYIGKSDELLLVFSLAWALGLAALVSIPIIGFSLEIGGFLAGIALANSAVHYQIGARIKSLRDFFIIIFFIVLGSQFAFNDIGSIIWPAIGLAVFVLMAKPVIVFFLLTGLGYKPRTALLSGISLSQISEFSLILVALGLQLGFIGNYEVSLLTVTSIITIALSSYMVLYDRFIYESLKILLSKFEREGFRENSYGQIVHKNHILLIGAHRLGGHLIESLIHQDRPFVVVDFNPDIAEKFASNPNVTAICGDITDPHIQELVNMTEAKLIISTIADHSDNLLLAEVAKKPPIRTRLVVVAHDETEALELYDRGVDYVILPHFIGGMHLTKLFKNGYKFTELKKLREQQLKIIHDRAS